MSRAKIEIIYFCTNYTVKLVMVNLRMKWQLLVSRQYMSIKNVFTATIRRLFERSCNCDSEQWFAKYNICRFGIKGKSSNILLVDLVGNLEYCSLADQK